MSFKKQQLLKHEELSRQSWTVSLSTVAREKLVNYHDATIYHNDKNRDIS